MGWRWVTAIGVTTVIGTAVLAACSHTTSTLAVPLVAEGCRVGQAITAHATTRSYIVQLDIGPVETVYTQAQAESQHPNGGEVILRGQMFALPADGGTAPTSGHHLEAHICSKVGGAVIQDAEPTITMVDDTTGSGSQDVQVAVMQGVGANVSDLHYGNNVVLTPGASYTITVSLNGETARLHVQIPPATTTVTTAGDHMSDMHGM